MKQNSSRISKRPVWKFSKYSSNTSRLLAVAVAVAILACCAVLTLAVRAYNRAGFSSANALASSTGLPAVIPGTGNGRFHSKLALQPEADKLRRKLGQRFLTSGREKSVLIGTLLVGTETNTVRIIRTQDDGGERVEIALGGGPANKTWTPIEGALSGGISASGNERVVIERIALDSPDQFILAQMRGDSYYTIARNAQPEGASDPENYTGPVWDLVRIREPEGEAQNRAQSPWRLYYLNSSTGLIDKIVSEDQGVTIMAEFSGWVNQGGEIVPTHITWSRNQQVVMELVIINVSHGQK